MKKIELVKYGFVRSPEDDFSDDGTRFTCFRVGDVRVSKTTYKGEVFLAGRLRERDELPYDIYSKLPHYKDLDKLNGVPIESVTEQDLIDLYNACELYSKEYKEAVENTHFPTKDELRAQFKKIKDHNADMLNEANTLVEQNALKIILSDSYWKTSSIKNYLKMLMSKANMDVDKEADRVYGSSYSFSVAKPDNKDLTETWYLDQIKEIVRDI